MVPRKRRRSDARKQSRSLPRRRRSKPRSSRSARSTCCATKTTPPLALKQTARSFPVARHLLSFASTKGRRDRLSTHVELGFPSRGARTLSPWIAHALGREAHALPLAL